MKRLLLAILALPALSSNAATLTVDCDAGGGTAASPHAFYTRGKEITIKGFTVGAKGAKAIDAGCVDRVTN